MDKNLGEPRGVIEPPTVQGQTALKWEYHRDSQLRVSKWVSGNNWVTKWDGNVGCIIGVNGTRIAGVFAMNSGEARRYVENELA